MAAVVTVTGADRAQATGRLVRDEAVVWRRVAAGVLLLAPRATEAVLVSGTGAAVWDLLAHPMPAHDVVQLLAGAYEADAEVVAADLAPVLEEMVGRGLLLPLP